MPDDDQRARAVKTFERRDVDTDGVSVFEVEDERDRSLVVAAIACARVDDKPVDFIEVSRDVIEEYGPITRTPGTLPVPAANVLHRCLDWDAETLRRLAEDLCEAKVVGRRVASKEVRALVATLDPSEVTVEESVAFIVRMRERTQRS